MFDNLKDLFDIDKENDLRDFDDFNENMIAVDLDGDGIADGFVSGELLDRDGDGVPDVITTEMHIDIDGDGVFDTLIRTTGIDLDGDGIFDSLDVETGMDLDGDGIFDQYEFARDLDGDGVIDQIEFGYDSDGDGILDAVESFDMDDFEQFGVTAGSASAYENFNLNRADSESVIGDPEEVMEHWHVQESDSSCAIASQEFVLEQLTGREYHEAELAEIAEEFGWYTADGGTPMADVGNLLEHMGLQVNRSQGNTISDLERCLANGGEVIVGVDSDELWNGANDEWFAPGLDADHAVQVIGIDRSNPDNPMIILNDSGVANGRGAMVSLDDFMDAWEDSGCFMVEAYA